MWDYSEGNHLVLVKVCPGHHDLTRKPGGGRDFVLGDADLNGCIAPRSARHMRLCAGTTRLCLVNKGHPGACVLEDDVLRKFTSRQGGNHELRLKSHPGQGFVPMWDKSKEAFGQWGYIDMSVGRVSRSKPAMAVNYDGQFLIANVSGEGEMALDVSMWKYSKHFHFSTFWT